MADARSAGDPSSHSGQGTKPPNNRPGRGRFSNVAYASVPIQGSIGHRQVTEAYLAQLARRGFPARRVRPGDGQAAQCRGRLGPGQLTAEVLSGDGESYVGSDQGTARMP